MFDHSCSIIGYDPDKLPFGYNEEHDDCDLLKQRLIKEIVGLCHKGCKSFFTDANIGVGLWCAEIVLSLQTSFDDLKIICVVPYEGREDRWNEEYRSRYNHVIENSFEKIVIDKAPTLNSALDCKNFLMEHGDIILAVCDDTDTDSEIRKALSYSESLKKKVIVIAP